MRNCDPQRLNFAAITCCPAKGQVAKFAHPDWRSKWLSFFQSKAPLFVKPPARSSAWKVRTTWKHLLHLSSNSVCHNCCFKTASAFRRTSKCPKLQETSDENSSCARPVVLQTIPVHPNPIKPSFPLSIDHDSSLGFGAHHHLTTIF